MKRIELQRYDKPALACACVEVEDPGGPGPGEVLVAMAAAAINPADLLIMEGRYPGPVALPAPVGIEGAGHVLEIGPGVDTLQIGDLVVSLGRANWAERILVPAETLIPLPRELSLQDAAMIKANPPSALLMLRDYVDLNPGDWVIQNAANSAVGRHLIRFAQARDLKTINVVRRDSLIPELETLGADLVLVDGEDLAARVRAHVGEDAPVRLGIDAIAGQACLRLADCLSEGATLVNYGFLSGDPCMVTPTHTIVRGITLTGFWLVGFMRRSSHDEIAALYATMAKQFIDGTLQAPVQASYPLEHVAQALAQAAGEHRNGKILFTMAP